jgi:hypothetical protein
MKSILDPTFRYTASSNTDLRKTFARVRREMRKHAQAANVDNKIAVITPHLRRADSRPR